MPHRIRVYIKDQIYHLVLNQEFEIEQISNEFDVLWPDRDGIISVDEVLKKHSLNDAYLKEKANLEFLNYFSLPLQVHPKALIKAMTRVSLTVFFNMLISALPIPIISAAIVSHPIFIILGMALLALGTVLVKEPIVSLKY